MSNENLRVKEVAKYLGVSVSTVWLYVKEKKLKKIKLSPRVTIFPKDDIDAFLRKRMSEE